MSMSGKVAFRQNVFLKIQKYFLIRKSSTYQEQQQNLNLHVPGNTV